MSEEGFFCEKCGTVYTSGIMACSTCQPKIYQKLANDLLEDTNALLYGGKDEKETAQEAGNQAGETAD